MSTKIVWFILHPCLQIHQIIPLLFISNKQYPSIYIINNILYVYLFVNKNNIRSSIVTIKTRCSYLMKYKVDAREGLQEATSCKFYSKSLK